MQIPIFYHCFLLFSWFAFISANEVSLTFDRLVDIENAYSYDNTFVRMRGFIYLKNGKTILSPQSNLKSCCVGASHDLHQQVLLLEELEECSLRAIDIVGLFNIIPSYNEKGELTQLYVLSQIRLPRGESSWPLMALIVFLLIAGAIVYVNSK